MITTDEKIEILSIAKELAHEIPGQKLSLEMVILIYHSFIEAIEKGMPIPFSVEDKKLSLVSGPS